MKRLVCLGLLLVVLLAGCAGTEESLDRAMGLRAKMLSHDCAFQMEITADSLSELCSFQVDCKMDVSGDVTFQVLAPESIAGIQGTIGRDKGKLTFDDAAVAFPLLADGEISPASAPWILTRTLRSGYLTSCGQEGELLRVAIDDSYGEDALHLDVWLTEEDIPCRADITWRDRRIVSMDIENFTIL